MRPIDIFLCPSIRGKKVFSQWLTHFPESFPLHVWKIQASPRHALDHSDPNASDSEGSNPGRCSFLMRFAMSNRTSAHSLEPLITKDENTLRIRQCSVPQYDVIFQEVAIQPTSRKIYFNTHSDEREQNPHHLCQKQYLRWSPL